MNQYSKLEKADILEMTVKHLHQLQRHNVTQAISHDPTIANKYKAGFNECASEVIRYLGSLHELDDAVRERLVRHLGSVVTSVNYQSRDEGQCSQISTVQIPQLVNQGTVSAPVGSLLMPVGVSASQVIQSNTYTGYARVPVSPVLHVNQANNFNSSSVQSVNKSSFSGAPASYPGQRQPTYQCNKTALTILSHTHPRTKASLKAYDHTTFPNVTELRNGQVLSQGLNSENEIPSCSHKCMENEMDCQLRDIVAGYSRTPSPLKGGYMWRPW